MFNKTGYPELTPQDVAKKMKSENVVVVDVREPNETAEGYIEGAKLIPMGQVGARLKELGSKDQNLIMVCRSGGRSSQVTIQLMQAGYTNVSNMAGGMLAWQAARLPIKH